MAFLDALSGELSELGFVPVREDAFTVVLRDENHEGDVVRITDLDGWVVVRQYTGLVGTSLGFASSLLLANDRALGCRFSLDGEGQCWLVSDILAAEVSASGAARIIDNMLAILPFYWPHLDEAAKTGKPLDDEQLDMIADAINGRSN